MLKNSSVYTVFICAMFCTAAMSAQPTVRAGSLSINSGIKSTTNPVTSSPTTSTSSSDAGRGSALSKFSTGFVSNANTQHNNNAGSYNNTGTGTSSNTGTSTNTSSSTNTSVSSSTLNELQEQIRELQAARLELERTTVSKTDLEDAIADSVEDKIKTLDLTETNPDLKSALTDIRSSNEAIQSSQAAIQSSFDDQARRFTESLHTDFDNFLQVRGLIDSTHTKVLALTQEDIQPTKLAQSIVESPSAKSILSEEVATKPSEIKNIVTSELKDTHGILKQDGSLNVATKDEIADAISDTVNEDTIADILESSDRFDELVTTKVEDKGFVTEDTLESMDLVSNTELNKKNFLTSNSAAIQNLATKDEVTPAKIVQKIAQNESVKQALKETVGSDQTSIQNEITRTLETKNIIDENTGELNIATKADIEPSKIAEQLANDSSAKQVLSAQIGGTDETAVKNLIKNDLLTKGMINESGESLVASKDKVEELTNKTNTLEATAVTTENINTTLKNYAKASDVTADEIAKKLANSETAQARLAGKIGPDETAVQKLINTGLESKGIIDTEGTLTIATKDEVGSLVTDQLKSSNVLKNDGTLNVAKSSELDTVKRNVSDMQTYVAAGSDVQGSLLNKIKTDSAIKEALKGEDGKSVSLDEVVDALKNDSSFINETKGKDGQNFALRGKLETYRELLALTDVQGGDAWFVEEDGGLLYVYTCNANSVCRFPDQGDGVPFKGDKGEAAETAWHAYCTTDNHLTQIIQPLFGSSVSCDTFSKEQFSDISTGSKAYCISLINNRNNLISNDGVGARIEKIFGEGTIRSLQNGAFLTNVRMPGSNESVKFLAACNRLFNKIASGEDAKSIEQTFCEAKADGISNATNLDIITRIFPEVRSCDEFNADYYAKLTTGEYDYCVSLTKKFDSIELGEGVGLRLAKISAEKEGKTVDEAKRTLEAIKNTNPLNRFDKTITFIGNSFFNTCLATYNELMTAEVPETPEHVYCMANAEGFSNKTNLDLIKKLYPDIDNCDQFTADQYAAITGGAKAYCMSLVKTFDTVDLDKGVGAKLIKLYMDANPDATEEDARTRLTNFKKQSNANNRLATGTFGQDSLLQACINNYNEIMTPDTPWYTYCNTDNNLKDIIIPLYNITTCSDFTKEQYGDLTSGAKDSCLSLLKKSDDWNFEDGIGVNLAEALGKEEILSLQQITSLREKITAPLFDNRSQTFMQICEAKYSDIIAGKNAKSVEQTYCEADAEGYPRGTKNLDIITALYPDIDNCENFTKDQYAAMTSGPKAYCLAFVKDANKLNLEEGVGEKLTKMFGYVQMNNFKRATTFKARMAVGNFEGVDSNMNFVAACEEKYKEITSPETAWYSYCTSKNDKDSSKTNLQAIITPLYGIEDCKLFTSEQYNAILGGAKAYCLSLAQQAKEQKDTFEASDMGKKLTRVLGKTAVTNMKNSGIAASVVIDSKEVKVVDACVEKYNEIMGAETAWYSYCSSKNDKDNTKTNLQAIVTPLYGIEDCKEFTEDQYNALMGGAKAYCLLLAQQAKEQKDTFAESEIGIKLTKVLGEDAVARMKNNGVGASITVNSKEVKVVDECAKRYNEIMAPEKPKSVEMTYCEADAEGFPAGTKNLDLIMKLYPQVQSCDDFTSEEYAAITGGAEAYCLSLAKDAGNINLKEGIGEKLVKSLGDTAMTNFTAKNLTFEARMSITGFKDVSSDKNFLQACKEKYNEIMTPEKPKSVEMTYCEADAEGFPSGTKNLDLIMKLYPQVQSCDDFTSEEYAAITGGAEAYCLSLAKDAGNLKLDEGIGEKLTKSLGAVAMTSFADKTKSFEQRMRVTGFTGVDSDKNFLQACKEKYNEIMTPEKPKSVEMTYCEADAEGFPSGTKNLDLIMKLYPQVQSCDDFTSEEYAAITGGAEAYCLSLAKDAENLNVEEGIGKKLVKSLGANAMAAFTDKTKTFEQRMQVKGFDGVAYDKNFLQACKAKYNEIMQADSAWYSYCMSKNDKDNSKTNLQAIITPLYGIEDCKNFTEDQYNAILGGAKAYCLSLAQQAKGNDAFEETEMGKKVKRVLGDDAFAALKTNGIGASITKNRDGVATKVVDECAAKYNEIMQADSAWYSYCMSKNEKDNTKTNLQAIITPLYGIEDCKNFTEDQYNAILGGAKAYCLSLAQQAKGNDAFEETEMGKKVKRVLGDDAFAALKTNGIGASITKNRDGVATKVVDECAAKYNEIMQADSAWYSYCMSKNEKDNTKTNLQAIITPLYGIEDCKNFTEDQYNAILGGAKAYCLSLAQQAKGNDAFEETEMGKKVKRVLGDDAFAALKTNGIGASITRNRDGVATKVVDECAAKYNEIMQADTTWYSYCMAKNDNYKDKEGNSLTNLDALITPLYGVTDCKNFTEAQYNGILGGEKAYCMALAQQIKDGGTEFEESEKGKKAKSVLGNDAYNALKEGGIGAVIFRRDGPSSKVVDECAKKYNELVTGDNGKDGKDGEDGEDGEDAKTTWCKAHTKMLTDATNNTLVVNPNAKPLPASKGVKAAKLLANRDNTNGFNKSEKLFANMELCLAALEQDPTLMNAESASEEEFSKKNENYSDKDEDDLDQFKNNFKKSLQGESAEELWCKAHSNQYTDKETGEAVANNNPISLPKAKAIIALDYVTKNPKRDGSSSTFDKVNARFATADQCLDAVKADPTLMNAESASEEQFSKENADKSLDSEDMTTTKLVEYKNDFKESLKGKTFTPVIDDNGNLSWKDGDKVVLQGGKIKQTSTDIDNLLKSKNLATATEIAEIKAKQNNTETKVAQKVSGMFGLLGQKEGLTADQEQEKAALESALASAGFVKADTVMTMSTFVDLINGGLVVDGEGKVKLNDDQSDTKAQALISDVQEKLTEDLIREEMKTGKTKEQAQADAASAVTGKMASGKTSTSLKTTLKNEVTADINQVKSRVSTLETSGGGSSITRTNKDKCLDYADHYWNGSSDDADYNTYCKTCNTGHTNASGSTATERCLCSNTATQKLDTSTGSCVTKTQAECTASNTFYSGGSCKTCPAGINATSNHTSCACPSYQTFNGTSCVNRTQSNCNGTGEYWNTARGLCLTCDTATTNNCTCKIANHVFDTTTGKCAACPSGTEYNNGSCVAITDAGQLENDCKAKEDMYWQGATKSCEACPKNSNGDLCACDDDAIFNEYTGECVKQEECGPGEVFNIEYGRCLAECEFGMIPSGPEGECEEATAENCSSTNGYFWNVKKDFCEACPEGTNEKGECTCKEADTFFNSATGTCEVCPEDATSKDGTCICGSDKETGDPLFYDPIKNICTTCEVMSGVLKDDKCMCKDDKMGLIAGQGCVYCPEGTWVDADSGKCLCKEGRYQNQEPFAGKYCF